MYITLIIILLSFFSFIFFLLFSFLSFSLFENISLTFYPFIYSSNLFIDGDYDYYTTFSEFKKETKNLSNDTTSLIQDISSMIQSSSLDLPIDLMDSSLYEIVVEMIDMLLDRADIKLDGLIERDSKIVKTIQQSLNYDKERLFHETSLNIRKPQLEFLSDIDNSYSRPFKPKLQIKPNSIAPWDSQEQPIELSSDEQINYLGPKTYYLHPYEPEIKHFSKNISSMTLYFQEIESLDPQIPSEISSYPLQYVDDLPTLLQIIPELNQVTELAIDLEHHSYRTFQGLTCLMQVIFYSLFIYSLSFFLFFSFFFCKLNK